MKLIKNTGDNRVIDELRRTMPSSAAMDVATPALSLFAFGELLQHLDPIERCRLVLQLSLSAAANLLGADHERSFRNHLSARALALRFTDWLNKRAEVKGAPKPLPQSVIVMTGNDGSRAIAGNCPLPFIGSEAFVDVAHVPTTQALASQFPCKAHV